MRLILMFALLMLTNAAFASIQIGSGLSSSMSGRLVPGVELALGNEVWRARSIPSASIQAIIITQVTRRHSFARGRPVSFFGAKSNPVLVAE